MLRRHITIAAYSYNLLCKCPVRTTVPGVCPVPTLYPEPCMLPLNILAYVFYVGPRKMFLWAKRSELFASVFAFLCAFNIRKAVIFRSSAFLLSFTQYQSHQYLL